ncbi:DNA-binding response regulator [Thermoanaerobacterium thermosaccharolyticum]|uniref:Stage 0 sporulation protein A homolog n=1 Tax=Thermoanaerobacterium thermosaccharolyticum TaxID=1517 RepID=A0A223I1N4_THETR|nr:response regulator transcription factor [Thermoanaerobacterium thermosaccharolyticum]AST58425.1 two component transcriptional regulator, winged helix family [Thermoanaerobacterium thermosaccharolyticum]PHO08202.1 DNA-binding response regulator [Thermoanaerobacterium thermosaccharolyticum]
MRILMIEDEKYMAEAVAQVLKKNNYTVDLAYNGEDGLDCGLSDIYDIIILDIMLPKMDGISILKELRKNGIETPVILLTARGEIEDRVRGLDSGADDYMSKPFHTDELLARLRALGRRKSELINDGILKYGDIELNPYTLQLQCGDKETVLTLKESQLLELLIKRKGMIVSKENIIEKLWGYDTDAEDNRVEIHVSLLRKKLAQLDSGIYIHTIRGAGYALKTKDGK